MDVGVWLILCLLGLYMGDSSLDSTDTDAESLGMAMSEAEELPKWGGFFGGMILSRGTVLGAAEASGSGSSCGREAFSGSAVAMDEAEELPISPGFFGGMILTRGMILRAVEASGFGSSCNRETLSGSAVAVA